MTAGAASAGELQLEVFVNGAPKNLIGAFRERADGSLAAAPDELRAIGLRPPPALSPDADGSVGLSALHGVRFRYDAALQRIDFQADPSALAVQEVAAAGAPATPAPSGGRGGVLNYGLFAESGWNGNEEREWRSPGASLSLDGRVFSGLGVLSQSAVLRGAEGTASALRLATTFEHADPDAMITYRAGDLIAGGLSWTRPFRLGGVQAQRRFGLRPDLVTRPLPSFSGSAAVPSTVDVFANGLRLYSGAMDAGPFRIADLPLVGQSGEAQVVVRDAAGRTTTTSLAFFSAPELLRPGLSDFSVEAGVARLGFGSADDAYDERPLGAATLRLGLTDRLTVETHAEGGAGFLNAGAGLVAGVGKRSVASAALAASHSEHGEGLLAGVSLRTELFGASFSASLRQTFGDYEDVASITALSQADDGADGLSRFSFRPARRTAGLSFGAPLPNHKGSLGLNFVYLEDAAGKHSTVVAASFSHAAFWGGSFNASVWRDFESEDQIGFFAGLSVPLGGDVTGALYGEGEDRFGVEASRTESGTPGDEWGWRVRAEKNTQGSALAADTSYRTRFATGEVRAQTDGGGAAFSGTIDGAVSVVDGAVAMSNRIDDGFAVVETGIPGVEVLHENRRVGVTDRHGRLLVPDLRSFERNRLAISPDGLPVDAEIAQTEATVVPSDRAGVSVELRVEAGARTALAAFVDEAGSVLPAGSQGQVEGGQTFVVGYDGQAFLKGLGAQNVAVIETPAGRCVARFAFAPKPGEQVYLAPVPCRLP